ncbi:MULTISPECIES: hypothetical protein [Bacillus cereus group]|uniref:hypothetical protein n=1 Tax=Bacillus cereus group TaxID=86661 RepID=UPI00130203F7|nr:MULTISPECIES: hypothetical protein [Bacillus cereus group]
MKESTLVQIKSEIVTNQDEINKYKCHLVMAKIEVEKTEKKIKELEERRETLLNCL